MPQLLLICITIMTGYAVAKAGNNEYWWMSNPDVFSSGLPANQAVMAAAAAAASQPNPNYGSSSDVETECPVGTKCVDDFFCDQNAVMVSSRIQLTPDQKRKRGKLIPCVNGPSLGVCCSTASGVQPAVGLSSSSSNQQLQQLGQATVPSPNVPSGSCPVMASLPPVEACSQRSSNCWSVGQADWDCPNNALCCFDGCVNSCYFGGGGGTGSDAAPPPFQTPAPPKAPQAQSFVNQPPFSAALSPSGSELFSSSASLPASPANVPASGSSFQAPASGPSFQSPASGPSFHAPASGSSFQSPASGPSFQSPASGPSFQSPSVPPAPPTFSASSIPSSAQVSHRPLASNVQGRPQATSFPLADTKPFVRCPSAMLCIPRVNCDFNGVITKTTFNLSPELEMLRVPLIPCVNEQTGTIDVCCRDPDYKDPWPQGMAMSNTLAISSPGLPNNQSPANQFDQAATQVGSHGQMVAPPRRRTGYGK